MSLEGTVGERSKEKETDVHLLASITVVAFPPSASFNSQVREESL